mgnify:FL=1|tara:strand:- start:212743 stop:214338 length:1596 start_codon:yes stop_codon:yes gene_type:complete
MNYTLRFIVLPVLIVGLIAFILIFVTRSVVKYEVESANDTTREIVNGVLEIHRGNLIRLVMDYAHWDDAVTMIFVEPDKEQTEVNFGQFLIDTYKISSSIILDKDRRLLLSWLTHPGDPESGMAFDPPLSALIRQADEMVNGLHQPATGFALLNGVPHIIAVAQITRNLEPGIPQPHFGYFIVSRAIDIALMSSIEEHFGVLDLRFMPNVDGPAIIHDYSGRVLGSFFWKPSSAGANTLKIVGPWALGSLILIVAGFLFLVLRVLKTTQKYEQLSSNLEVQVRQRTEELNMQRERAEQASLAKTEFLSRMSHELRTPLNAVLGFGQLLEMDANQLKPEHSEQVHYILDAGNHLLELVNEVLDVAAIDSGKLNLEIDNVALDTVLKKSIMLVTPLAEKREIRLTQAGDSGLLVRADPRRLTQILVNLLTNAIKYNHPNGTVVVSAEAGPEGEVRISVQDTGIGIATEDQQTIFEAFGRVGKWSTSVEGSGIGLAISLRLTELMGGSLGVESHPGAGSMFWLDLPQAINTEHI